MHQSISSASPSHVKLASGETCNIIVWKLDSEGDVLAGYIFDGELCWFFPASFYADSLLVDGPAPEQA